MAYLCVPMIAQFNTYKRSLFAGTLLSVWALVIGLEVHHQFGHVVAGCNHHHHHGHHAHHHDGCTEWSGTHAEDHWLVDEHACTICGWDFSPVQGGSIRLEGNAKGAVHACALSGCPCPGFHAATWQTSWSERGPPARS